MKARWKDDNWNAVSVSDAQSGPDAWNAANDFIEKFSDEAHSYALATPHGEYIEPNERGEYIFPVKLYRNEDEIDRRQHWTEEKYRIKNEYDGNEYDAAE